MLLGKDTLLSWCFSVQNAFFFTYIDMYVCELDDIQCNTPTDRLLYQLIYFSPVLDDLAVIA